MHQCFTFWVVCETLYDTRPPSQPDIAAQGSWGTLLVTVEAIEIVGVEPVGSQVEQEIASQRHMPIDACCVLLRKTIEVRIKRKNIQHP